VPTRGKPPERRSELRRAHGRSGGQAIVDEHHVSRADLDGRLLRAIHALAAQHLVELAPRDLFDRCLLYSHLLDHLAVEHDTAPAGDSSHRQLFVAGYAELTYDEYVQWGAERSCYLERDRNAAARERQHERIASSQ
jgi:hypothetical protein